MAQQIRLNQLRDFDPQPDKWRNDKRAFEQATGALEVMVAKNFSKLALPCVALYPEMDKGKFVGFKVAVPDGPLKDYFAQDDTKKLFFDLFQDACIDAMAKKERKRSGEDVQTSLTLSRTIIFPKPPRPIWIMTVKELETYFSILKSKVAVGQGVKLKRKWPKLVEGKAVELPTKIPAFDEVTDRILPSSMFVPGQKFPLGNVHWRLKLVCAYIFMIFNKNHNTFADEVPDNFAGKAFNVEDLKKFSNAIDDSAAEHHVAKKRKVVNQVEDDLHNIPFFEIDNFDYEGYEASDEENDNHQANNSPSPELEISVQSQKQQPPQGSSTRAPPGPTQSCSRTLPVLPRPSRTSKEVENPLQNSRTMFDGMVSVSVPLPNDVFMDRNELCLNTTHDTGTPGNSI